MSFNIKELDHFYSYILGKAVASFFTPISKKEQEKMTWRVVKDSLLVGRYNASATVQSTSKSKRSVAAFDFVCLREHRASSQFNAPRC